MRWRSDHAAVFLDRDGTINREVSYLARAAALELLPGAAEALALLRHAGYRLVVVTNQSGVARGLFTLRRMKKINKRFIRMLRKAGVRLDGLWSCPWHAAARKGPFRGEHPCRKPAPGMLEAAAARLGIRLDASWMIGDREGDIAAGAAAGCRTILVRTGYGAAAEAQVPAWKCPPDHIAADLGAATALILEEERHA